MVLFALLSVLANGEYLMVTQCRSAAARRLSICTPTYNRPELLRRALASVTDVPPDIEIVVSDNSTNDESAQLCQRLFEDSQGQNHYFRNPPGVNAIENHNLCIGRATGDWVLILHDDDYLLPGGISAITKAIETAGDECKAMLFGVKVTDHKDKVMKRQAFRREMYLEPREALRNVLGNSSFVRIPGMVVRRDAYIDLGGFALDVGGPIDFDMWCRLFSLYGVRCVPLTTAAYTVHTDTITSGMFDMKTLSELQKIFDRVATECVLSESEVRRYQRDFFHQFILGGTYRQIRWGDRVGAERIMKLFRSPQVKQLGISPRWAPIRAAFHLVTIGPGSSPA